MTAQSQIVNNPSRLRAHSLGIDAPELSQYQDEPEQMHSGAVGKSGYLRLGFERRGNRSVLADMERRVPSLVQRALYWDEEMPELPCVTMISTSGLPRRPLAHRHHRRRPARHYCQRVCVSTEPAVHAA